MKLKSRADDAETHLLILPSIQCEITNYEMDEIILSCIWLNILNDFLCVERVDEASIRAMEAISLIFYPLIHSFVSEFSNTMGFDTEKGHACVVRLLDQIRYFQMKMS